MTMSSRRGARVHEPCARVVWIGEEGGFRVCGEIVGVCLFVAECFSGRLRIRVKCILGCLGRFVCLLNSGDSWYFIVCDDFFCIRSRLFSDITVIKGL